MQEVPLKHQEHFCAGQVPQPWHRMPGGSGGILPGDLQEPPGRAGRPAGAGAGLLIKLLIVLILTRIDMDIIDHGGKT